jgi:hypothetical protein
LATADDVACSVSGNYLFVLFCYFTALLYVWQLADYYAEKRHRHELAHLAEMNFTFWIVGMLCDMLMTTCVCGFDAYDALVWEVTLKTEAYLNLQYLL